MLRDHPCAICNVFRPVATAVGFCLFEIIFSAASGGLGGWDARNVPRPGSPFATLAVAVRDTHISFIRRRTDRRTN